jgi:hypothetical protein
MAEHNEVAYTTADGNDYEARRRGLHRCHDGNFSDLTVCPSRRDRAARFGKIARFPTAKPVSIFAK